MRDQAARTRTGLNKKRVSDPDLDSRIHIDLNHLMELEPLARRLNLLPRQPARSILNGRHASRLRGRGLNFEELRGYLPGDDSRTIDWKVTAKTGKPHVRVYTEERDRPALILVDQRMSMFFGSRLNMKSVTAAEAAAIAAFMVLNQGDRVGGIVFGSETLEEIRPRQSRANTSRFLELLVQSNRSLHADARYKTSMPLNRPLEAAARIAGSNHLVIVISDFDDVDDLTEDLLNGIAANNDLLLCLVSDPMAHNVEANWKLIISDGRLEAVVDTGDEQARNAVQAVLDERFARIRGWQEQIGVPVLPLTTETETLTQIRALLGGYDVGG